MTDLSNTDGESTLLTRLKEREKRRAEFSATVNHNLKTPLNGIIGFSSVLLAEADNMEPEQRHQLRLVYDSARQLLDRIDALLSLQRMESGKIEPSQDWFNAGELLLELADQSKDAASRNNMQIDTDFGAAPIMLFSDMNLIRRALHEFVDNAIRFGSGGTCTLGVNAHRQEAESSVKVVFSVTNQGRMPADLKNHILRSLDKDIDYLDTSFEGLGLGLALARQVAALLGGYIEPKFSDQTTAFSLVLKKDENELKTTI